MSSRTRRRTSAVPIEEVEAHNHRPDQTSPTDLLVAGAIAGAVSIGFLHPFDTVKTHIQSSGGTEKIKNGFHAARYIVKKRGVAGLWAGCSSAIAGAAPAAAVKLATFDFLSSRLAPALGHAHAAVTSGAVAGLLACFVYIPTEVVKSQLQHGLYPSGTRQAIKLIARDHGLAGFYRGILPTIARDVPFTFIELPVYRAVQRAWTAAKGATARRKRAQQDAEADAPAVAPRLGALEQFAVGGIAGAVASVVTNPLDVSKTMVMTKTAPDVPTAFRRVLASDGPRGLLRGVGVRAAVGIPNSCLFFGAFEGSKRALAARRSRRLHAAANPAPAPESQTASGAAPGTVAPDLSGPAPVATSRPTGALPAFEGRSALNRASSAAL
eukprot:tig00020927_g15978.t1